MTRLLLVIKIAISCLSCWMFQENFSHYSVRIGAFLNQLLGNYHSKGKIPAKSIGQSIMVISDETMKTSLMHQCP
jgi:hypothetical protein